MSETTPAVQSIAAEPITIKPSRLPFIDWLRGFFILLMVIYHFCYDLDLFGYIDTAFGRGAWIPFRYVIVIGFLTLVGISLVIVHHKGINWQSVKKRSFQLAIACLFVSGSGYFIAPHKITIFGILQFILVASFLVLPFINKPKLALVLGIAVFAIGHSVTFPLFNSIWLHWIGMGETLRPALDFLPLVPWIGVVLVGIYCGHWFISETGNKVGSFTLSEHKNKLVSKLSRFIETMGQHSLIIYLVHQPILFGIFYALEYVN